LYIIWSKITRKDKIILALKLKFKKCVYLGIGIFLSTKLRHRIIDIFLIPKFCTYCTQDVKQLEITSTKLGICHMVYNIVYLV